MAYRETEKTRRRKAQLRANILAAAYEQVAEGGFGSASIAAVSERAGIATGTVYKYFPSKEALFAEVFRMATQRELEHVRAAVATPGSARERLANGLTVFASRAIRGRRVAWALIAEPVDPGVEGERLIFRKAYADIFEQIIVEGVTSGAFPEQTPAISAAALVGVMAETLVGPLAPEASVLHAPEASEIIALDEKRFIRDIRRFCLQAITGETDPG